MVKVLSMFNNKGGVSKTTTTYHLGWAIAAAGKRVLMVDCDSQCNLTGYALSYGDYSDLSKFYVQNPEKNIHSALEPVIKGQPLKAAGIIETQQEGLFIVPGHPAFANFEEDLAGAMTGKQRSTQRIPGAMNHLIRMTAEANNIDIVILDMSPSISFTNKCLLMGSDFFLVPTIPDFFCYQAIGVLAKVLPQWEKDMVRDGYRNKDMQYPLPATAPQFIGIVSQRFRTHADEASKGYQEWIEKIEAEVDSVLVPALRPLKMTVTKGRFSDCTGEDPFTLAKIPDFNSLVTKCHKHCKPVFALSDKEIGFNGYALEINRQTVDLFRWTYRLFSEGVMVLMDVMNMEEASLSRKAYEVEEKARIKERDAQRAAAKEKKVKLKVLEDKYLKEQPSQAEEATEPVERDVFDELQAVTGSPAVLRTKLATVKEVSKKTSRKAKKAKKKTAAQLLTRREEPTDTQQADEVDAPHHEDVAVVNMSSQSE